MHSRIFKVCLLPSVEKDGDLEKFIGIAAENNAACADDYYDHWFTSTHADYVADDEHPDESLEWLFSDLLSNGHIETDSAKKTFVLGDGFKEAYFRDAFSKFKDCVSQAANISLSDFVSADTHTNIPGAGSIVHSLQSAYEDDGGFYIDLADMDDGYSLDLVSFDAFVRMAEIGRTYYVVGSVDYHY